MDKKKFLNKLKKALRKLTPDEREKYISYYDEIISDMVDGGLEEEEAVKRQGEASVVAQEILSQVDKDSLVKKNIWEIILLVVAFMFALVSTIVLIALPDVMTFAMMDGDGPTSVFVAGKVKEPFWLYIITALVLVACIIVFALRRKAQFVIALSVALLVFGATFVVVRLDDSKVEEEIVTTEEIGLYSTPEVEERTKLVIKLVSEDDFTTLRDEYSIDDMKYYLSGNYMLEAKAMISEDWGRLVSISNIYSAEITQNNIDYTVVQVNVTYENVAIAYTITFDNELMLAGLYMR